jgi:hypothetical protein
MRQAAQVSAAAPCSGIGASQRRHFTDLFGSGCANWVRQLGQRPAAARGIAAAHEGQWDGK